MFIRLFSRYIQYVTFWSGCVLAYIHIYDTEFKLMNGKLAHEVCLASNYGFGLFYSLRVAYRDE